MGITYFLFAEENLGLGEGGSKLQKLHNNADPWLMVMAMDEPEKAKVAFDAKGGKDPKDPERK